MIVASEYVEIIEHAAQRMEHPELVSADQSTVLPKSQVVLLKDSTGHTLGAVRLDCIIRYRPRKLSTVLGQKSLQAELNRTKALKHEPLFTPGLLQLLAGLEVEGAQEAAIRLSRLSEALITQAHADDGSPEGDRRVADYQAKMKDAGFPEVMIDREGRLAGAKAMESLADAIGHLLDVRRAQAARDLRLLSGKAVS